MKVNLLHDQPNDIRSGYLNLDPYAPPNCEDGRLDCKDYSLNGFVENGECQELVTHDILTHFPADVVDSVLNGWLAKLAHGGRIAFSIVDFREVCRAHLNGVIDLNQANALLFGENSTRLCTLTLAQLTGVLQTKGLKILKKQIENYRAIVVAERP